MKKKIKRSGKYNSKRYKEKVSSWIREKKLQKQQEERERMRDLFETLEDTIQEIQDEPLDESWLLDAHKNLLAKHNITFADGNVFIPTSVLENEHNEEKNNTSQTEERLDEWCKVDIGEFKEYDSNNMVDHPKHYEGNTSIECIDAMRMIASNEGLAWHCILTAFKYLWRWEHKANPIQDLEKAKWYIDYANEKTMPHIDPSIASKLKTISELYHKAMDKLNNK